MITYMAHTVTTVDHQDEPKKKVTQELISNPYKVLPLCIGNIFVMFLAATYFK